MRLLVLAAAAAAGALAGFVWLVRVYDEIDAGGALLGHRRVVEAWRAPEIGPDDYRIPLRVLP